MSLINKRYRFTLISKDTYCALTEDEREQVVGDLWKKAKERLDRQIEEEWHGQYPEPLLEEWLSSVESARDAKTVDHYRLDLQRFLHVAPPRTGQLSSRVQEPYYDHLRILGLSDSSINSAVRSVRVFVKWLSERELLKHPVTLKALRTVKKRVQFYSIEHPDHAGLLQRDPRQKIYVIIQDNLDLESDCNEGGTTAEFEMVRSAAKEDQDYQHRRLGGKESQGCLGSDQSETAGRNESVGSRRRGLGTR